MAAVILPRAQIRLGRIPEPASTFPKTTEWVLYMSFRCFVYALPLSFFTWAVIVFCIATSARYLAA